MLNEFSRTELIFGKKAVEKLKKSRVAVFGIGGVGSFAAEALARSGVGSLDLIDSDRISLTNINRQIYALHSTIGRYKVDVARERITDINPACAVSTYSVFYAPDTEGLFDFSVYDYIVDAIDTVTGKIALAVNAQRTGVPIISSMGTGNKLDPTAFEVTDIYKTSVCPLARVMRRELKNRGVSKLKVVYSKEPPVTPDESYDEVYSENASEGDGNRRAIPGSNAFVPSAAGLIIAGEVVKDLIAKAEDDR